MPTPATATAAAPKTPAPPPAAAKNGQLALFDTAGTGIRRFVAFKLLDVWTGNPRQLPSEDKLQDAKSSKEIKELNESIDNLAGSIAEIGIEENLLVRPKGDRFEVVAGQCRHRAVSRLVKEKIATAEYQIPVWSRPMSDSEALQAALAENLGGVGALKPMEEAEAFKKLAGEGVPTKEIARRAGCTQRNVQQRIAMATKLTPETKKAVENGEIKIEQARALTMAPPAKQKELVKEIKETTGHWDEPDEEQLRGSILEDMTEATAAPFDRALYKGDVVKDEETGKEYFSDGDQVEKLIQAEINKKVAELKGKWGWVQVMGWNDSEYFDEWDWEKKPKDPKAGAIIEFTGGKLKIHAGLVKKKEATTSGRAVAKSANKAAGKSDPVEAFQKSHRVHAHLRKSFALQRAVANDPLAAQRILCAALILEKFDPINVIVNEDRWGSGQFEDHDGPAIDASVIEQLGKLTGGAKGKVKLSNKSGASAAAGRDAEEIIWNWLAALKAEALGKLLAHLTALYLGTWCARRTPIEDTDAAIAIAAHVGVAGAEAKHGLTLQIGDLEGLRKPALIGICKAIGCWSEIGGGDTYSPTHAKPSMTASAIRDVIAKRIKYRTDVGARKNTRCTKTENYVLPTLKFGDAAAMKKAAKDLVKE